jgi:hypothetical protein
MPSVDDLPPSLAKLAHCQALKLNQDSFESDLSQLIGGVDKFLSEARQWITLYDSRRSGFSKSDFHLSCFGEAKGRLESVTQEARNDTLVIYRENKNDTIVAWLKKYDYIGGSTVIPVGDAWGMGREFRVRCKVQAHAAEHTFKLMLKLVRATEGHYMGVKDFRIIPGAWTHINILFDEQLTADCELRLEDCEVSEAPTRLEIRDLIVTERELP